MTLGRWGPRPVVQYSPSHPNEAPMLTTTIGPTGHGTNPHQHLQHHHHPIRTQPQAQWESPAAGGWAAPTVPRPAHSPNYHQPTQQRAVPYPPVPLVSPTHPHPMPAAAAAAAPERRPRSDSEGASADAWMHRARMWEEMYVRERERCAELEGKLGSCKCGARGGRAVGGTEVADSAVGGFLAGSTSGDDGDPHPPAADAWSTSGDQPSEVGDIRAWSISGDDGDRKPSASKESPSAAPSSGMATVGSDPPSPAPSPPAGPSSPQKSPPREDEGPSEGIVDKEPEGRWCASCDEVKAKGLFSDKQWRRDDRRFCNPCLSERTKGRKCVSCGKEKFKTCYSKEQWKKEKATEVICKVCFGDQGAMMNTTAAPLPTEPFFGSCGGRREDSNFVANAADDGTVRSETPSVEEMLKWKCITCNDVKPQDVFGSKQRRKKDKTCRSCMLRSVKKPCGKCGRVKTQADFAKEDIDKHRAECRECTASAEGENQPVEETNKLWCVFCGEVTQHFRKSPDSVGLICRSCVNRGDESSQGTPASAEPLSLEANGSVPIKEELESCKTRPREGCGDDFPPQAQGTAAPGGECNYKDDKGELLGQPPKSSNGSFKQQAKKRAEFPGDDNEANMELPVKKAKLLDAELMVCNSCKKPKPKSAYSTSMWKKSKKESFSLRCRLCVKKERTCKKKMATTNGSQSKAEDTAEKTTAIATDTGTTAANSPATCPQEGKVMACIHQAIDNGQKEGWIRLTTIGLALRVNKLDVKACGYKKLIDLIRDKPECFELKQKTRLNWFVKNLK